MTVIYRDLVEQLEALQELTDSCPYSIVHRLRLAEAYEKLGYPDLAAGDAYKALLLIDEVLEQGDYGTEAMEAAKADFISDGISHLDMGIENQGIEGQMNDLLSFIQKNWSKNAYGMLIKCLLSCGCFRSASDYVSRAERAFPGDQVFLEYSRVLSDKIRLCHYVHEETLDDIKIQDYPDKGLVRREKYPWNKYEPDRFSDECLQFLNEEMTKVAPKLEIKAVDLPVLAAESAKTGPRLDTSFIKQLGVFAKENILPEEQILEEKSLLTAISRHHETYCDACSAKLLSLWGSEHTDEPSLAITCEECNEVYFCSVDCHDLAQTSYHPALCGMNIDYGSVPIHEAADSLYSLLVIRALALSVTQDLHPLELAETRYIWGDYHSRDLSQIWQTSTNDHASAVFGSAPRNLPFTFKNNVLTPLRILEDMGVNVFTEGARYDTWIFNTLFAKIRGTASAQQGLDGRPEIGAVHPLWCTANHSCLPNVAWEWQGNMRFWARKELVSWKGSDPTMTPGISKGEEIYSHYCDIHLPVKERREWAAGALGGLCMCPRCVDEEAAERLLHNVP